MKLRALTAILICLVIGLASLLSVGESRAQQFPQPFFMAPYTPGMQFGRFTLSAGVKYRNIQTVRFEVEPHTVRQVHSYGTVPFGPENEGTILYPYDAASGLPTLNPADVPDLSGIWEYDDGLIDPRSPGVEATDGNFGPAMTSFGLGYYNGSQNNWGYFTVADARFQTDPSAEFPTYGTTDHVLYTRRLDGVARTFEPSGGTASVIYVADVNHPRDVELTNKIWSPYVEVGYRQSSLFDMMLGVSWFTIGNVFQRRFPTEARLYRRTIHDSYTFDGQDPQVWVGGFQSWMASPSLALTNPVSTYSYLIYPAGNTGARDLPTRTFVQEIDPLVAPIAAEETLYHRLDFTAIEFKGGGRSWFPLYGMGEIGTSLGFLFTPMPVTIVTSSTVVSSEDRPDLGIVAGQELIYMAHKEEELWLWRNIGLFVGADLRFYLGNFFVQSNVEYDLYPMDNKYGDAVITTVNLSGVNAMFQVGGLF